MLIAPRTSRSVCETGIQSSDKLGLKHLPAMYNRCPLTGTFQGQSGENNDSFTIVFCLFVCCKGKNEPSNFQATFACARNARMYTWQEVLCM